MNTDNTHEDVVLALLRQLSPGASFSGFTPSRDGLFMKGIVRTADGKRFPLKHAVALDDDEDDRGEGGKAVKV